VLEGVGGLRLDQVTAVALIVPENPQPIYACAQVTLVEDDVVSLAFVALERDMRRRLSEFVTEHLRRQLTIVRSLQEDEDDDWD
jgi:hypothetical protein